MNQELYKEPLQITWMVPHAPFTDAAPIRYYLKTEMSIRFRRFNPLHSCTNQFKKPFCNQGSHYENTDDFRYGKETITRYHQIDSFCCQQKWRNHKGGHWYIHEECIIHTALCQKAGKDIKQWKNRARNLSRYWVTLVGQSVNQSVS